MPPLYPSHVPTSSLEKGFLSVFSAFKALHNPHRADMVAAFGETTGHLALARLRRRMRADSVGRRILTERPLIDSNLLKRSCLADLPADSFGGAYARFLTGHGYDPDERDAVRFVDDEELAYVMLRYRQTHDFAHVLCGLPPTVLGELALKWFETVQTQLPMCAASAVTGPLSLPRLEREQLRRDLIPWAVRSGRKTLPLINVLFEEEWETPLVDLRKRLRLDPAPGDMCGLLLPTQQK
mmetsp:Transcript_56096/g.112390  ORF Transcript_56096/g.112390 Transcript_56096/m.112390 type:complete len:239 (+) Transcript_56096:125-841(+)